MLPREVFDVSFDRTGTPKGVGTRADRSANAAAKEKSLDEVRSKEDLTLHDVYALGLEHDQENIQPEGRSKEERGRSRRKSR